MLQAEAKSLFAQTQVMLAAGSTVDFKEKTCFLLLYTTENFQVLFSDPTDSKKASVTPLGIGGKRLREKPIHVILDWVSDNILHVYNGENLELIVTEDGIYVKQDSLTDVLTVEPSLRAIATNGLADNNELRLSTASALSLENRTCFLMFFFREHITVLIQDHEAKVKAVVTTVSNRGGKILSVTEVDLDWKENGKLKFCHKGGDIEVAPITELV